MDVSTAVLHTRPRASATKWECSGLPSVARLRLAAGFGKILISNGIAAAVGLLRALNSARVLFTQLHGRSGIGIDSEAGWALSPYSTVCSAWLSRCIQQGMSLTGSEAGPSASQREGTLQGSFSTPASRRRMRPCALVATGGWGADCSASLNIMVSHLAWPAYP